MFKDRLTIACVQMCSGVIAEDNIGVSLDYIREAASCGANFVSLPEVVNLMQVDKAEALKQVYFQSEDSGLVAYCSVARELGLWLHIGSMVMRNDRVDGGGKLFINRGFVIGSDGEIVSSYDKLHMFDVNLSDSESYCESSCYASGDSASLVMTDWGYFGMSICYDLRFSYLYRLLSQSGARVLLVPAAFTRTTGEKHWHALLRARAIECCSWVVAVNQCGVHGDGRETYGHSLVIDPDGVVVMDGGIDLGVHLVELDLSLSDICRLSIPSLSHDNVPVRVDGSE